MKNQYPPIVEKSLKVIEHLNEKFGWFTIRVYQFPLSPGFETFLESMQRNLTRHGLFSNVACFPQIGQFIFYLPFVNFNACTPSTLRMPS